MISKEIRYMLAIRRYGSITKAADSLFITQSGLSKAVKNIERQLGSPLFSRIGNDLIPTHIGNRYMDYAEKICQICSDWNSECEDLLGEEKGQLTIAVALMRGSCLLPDVLSRFYSRYPDVQINLLEESHSVEKQHGRGSRSDSGVPGAGRNRSGGSPRSSPGGKSHGKGRLSLSLGGYPAYRT